MSEIEQLKERVRTLEGEVAALTVLHDRERLSRESLTALIRQVISDETRPGGLLPIK